MSIPISHPATIKRVRELRDDPKYFGDPNMRKLLEAHEELMGLDDAVWLAHVARERKMREVNKLIATIKERGRQSV